MRTRWLMLSVAPVEKAAINANGPVQFDFGPYGEKLQSSHDDALAEVRSDFCGKTPRWNLWARRHNDEWICIGRRLQTLRECFQSMRENPWAHFDLVRHPF